MKVLILNSPWINNAVEYGIKSGTRFAAIRKKDRTLPYYPFPYALASTAAYLRKEGFETHIKDAIAEEMSTEQCLEYVSDFNPSLVVIEVFTPSVYDDLDFSRKIKDSTGCWIALCGAHPSAQAEELMKYDFIDFILLKDFDIPLKELCHSLSQGHQNFDDIKSLAYKQNGTIKINEINTDLIEYDELPFPDREELPIKNYNEPLSKYFPNARMSTSRGCPFNCTFCIEPFMYQHNYRKRSVNLVIQEIEMLKSKYGVKEIDFDDALFTISRTKEIATAFIETGLKIAWTSWIDSRISLEDLKLLKKSGCVAIKIAIESANSNILSAIGKNRMVYIEKIKLLIYQCKKLNLLVHASFMIGSPGETKETIRETLDLAFSLDLHSTQFSIATPLPGTIFYKQAIENNWLTTKNWRKYESIFSCVVEYPDCTSKDIIIGIEEARKRKVKQFLNNPFTAIGYIWRLYKFLGFRKFYKDIFNKIEFIFNSFFQKYYGH